MDTEKIAEKIIQALDKIARDYDRYEYGLPVTNEDEMPAMIAAIESVLNSELSNWITVGERLPEDGQYLVLIHGYIVRCAKYQHQLWSIPYHEYASVMVTHWQPLPAPVTEK